MKSSFLFSENTSFLYDPAVFMLEQEYCILFLSAAKGIGWVEIEGKEYGVSPVGGLIPSDRDVHKIFVPMEVLDRAKKYSVHFCAVPERDPYFPKCMPEATKEYSFSPIRDKKQIRAYHLCDTHTHISGPTKTAAFFGGKPDLILMNGDIPNHSGSIQMIRKLHELCQNVAGGQIPILFARGNHDTRGAAAIDFLGCTPNRNGDMFYTARSGELWTLLLDCGEDKSDANVEYGGMISFDGYRRRQLEFLKQVNANADKEYNAPGVRHRIAMCHIPLYCDWNLFAKDIYAQWLEELNRMNLEVMFCGHTHTTEFFPDGRETGFGKMDFPIIVGGTMRGSDYVGTAVTFHEKGLDFAFTNGEHQVLEEHTIRL